MRVLHELRVLGPGRGHHLRGGPGGGPRQAAEGAIGEYQDILIYLHVCMSFQDFYSIQYRTQNKCYISIYILKWNGWELHLSNNTVQLSRRWTLNIITGSKHTLHSPDVFALTPSTSSLSVFLGRFAGFSLQSRPRHTARSRGRGRAPGQPRPPASAWSTGLYPAQRTELMIVHIFDSTKIFDILIYYHVIPTSLNRLRLQKLLTFSYLWLPLTSCYLWLNLVTFD